MEPRKLGHIEVSPIGLGCMGFSHGYGIAPEKEYSVKAIRNAYEYGCTFFDTAEVYGREQFYPGHNEELVGEAIGPFRKNIVLATKFHVGENSTNTGDKLLKEIQGHLEASMKRLHTDYIDIYYMHRTTSLIPLEEVALVMERLIADGVIRGWGLSQVSAEQIRKAHGVTPLSAVQNIYSMVERDCEDDIFPLCMKEGIGVVPFSPVASGLLSGKVTPNTVFGFDDVRKYVPQLSKDNIVANQPIIDLLNDFAAQKEATPAQISLAWMLHKYPNAVPIPGSKNNERILENLGAWNVNLTSSEFESLECALSRCTVHGHRGCVESEQINFGQNWRKKKVEMEVSQ